METKQFNVRLSKPVIKGLKRNAIADGQKLEDFMETQLRKILNLPTKKKSN